MWSQRARRDLGYALTQHGNPHQNAGFSAIPNPEHNSAHYMFLGQPYRITADPSTPHIQSPSTTHVQPPSPVSSIASYDSGEDPDASTLLVIDLQHVISDLEDQINILEEQNSDLQEQANVRDRCNSALSAYCRKAHERIVFLEGQIQRFAADRTPSTDRAMSTPVRSMATKHTPAAPQPTPSRYKQATSSSAQLT